MRIRPHSSEASLHIRNFKFWHRRFLFWGRKKRVLRESEKVCDQYLWKRIDVVVVLTDSFIVVPPAMRDLFLYGTHLLRDFKYGSMRDL